MVVSVRRAGLLLAAGAALAGCSIEGTVPYKQSPDTVIATGMDYGRDKGPLDSGEAAIAYDPDGCQNWIIDDGIEGYSSPRYDPVTGLPICNDRFPPGTVIGAYETMDAGIRDRVPRQTVRTVVPNN